MQKIFLMLGCILFATGCVHQTCHVGFDPMRPINEVWDMPKVAMVPVFDSSDSCLNWNVAGELTDAIRERILCDKNLFLLKEDETFNRILQTRHIACEDTRDRIWGIFGKAYFVVLIDLFQHDIVPTERENLPPEQRTCSKDCSSVLMMKARLTILDVHECTPKILLEEIVNSNQFVPKEFEFSNFSKSCWGSCYTWKSCDYEGTPAEKAHERLARVIVRRLQNVVWKCD